MKEEIRISSFLLLILLQLFPVITFGQSPQLKIGLLADVQYCDCETAGSREYAKSLGKLDEAIKVINGENVNLTVELGDLIDRDFASFAPVIQKMHALKARWVFVPGNHDFNVEDRLKKKVWKMIPSKKGYGSEVFGDTRLIYLNGFHNSVIAYAKGTEDYQENITRLEKLEQEKAKNAADWNGGLGKKQIKWIKEEVEKANRANQKLILFGHQPIIPDEAHSMWDSKKLIKALAASQHQVLYLCGHKHSGGDTLIGNIHILNLMGMVEQPKSSFGVLSVFADHYELHGYGSQASTKGEWK